MLKKIKFFFLFFFLLCDTLNRHSHIKELLIFYIEYNIHGCMCVRVCAVIFVVCWCSPIFDFISFKMHNNLLRCTQKIHYIGVHFPDSKDRGEKNIDTHTQNSFINLFDMKMYFTHSTHFTHSGNEKNVRCCTCFCCRFFWI